MKAAALFTILGLLLLGSGIVIGKHAVPAPAPAPAPAPTVSTAPAWCVDDGQAALDAAVAARVDLIRRHSPELEVDEDTVKATLMSECPLPPSLHKKVPISA